MHTSIQRNHTDVNFTRLFTRTATDLRNALIPLPKLYPMHPSPNAQQAAWDSGILCQRWGVVPGKPCLAGGINPEGPSDIIPGTLLCGDYNVPGFEHIDLIDVPILPLGSGDYDYGHGEVFTATDAENLVWKPILDWILTH